MKPAVVFPLLAAACLLLGACAVGPDYRKPDLPLPARWHAALPHDGNPDSLEKWWAQFDDPLLAALIAQAEANNPTLAQAVARIAQSRANAAAARSALWPTLDAKTIWQRSSELEGTSQKLSRGSLDAAWELDLFGGNRRTREAAEARLEGAQASWHDARVSLAAEVAQEYVSLRACEALLAETDAALASRRATAALTLKMVRAGFSTTADSALADASAAEGADRAIAQQAECDISVKSLVALTGEDEPVLRTRLAPRTAKLPQPASLTINALPVQALAHRPDLAVAERDLAAASAEIGSAEAARYPRLTLSGTVGLQFIDANGAGQQGRVWQFGPALDLPIFDAGRRAANADAARARYNEALAVYRMRVTQSVREVEQSLVRLDSAVRRLAETQRAADGYTGSFQAAEARWRAGIGSLLELEDTRRLALGARTQHLTTQREAVAAWIALYRAVGGDWPTPQDRTDPKKNQP